MLPAVPLMSWNTVWSGWKTTLFLALQIYVHGSRAVHNEQGQMFLVAAVLNSSRFIRLMLLFSQWQSGYTSVIWRDSYRQILDSAFDSIEAAAFASGKQQKWAAVAGLGKEFPIIEGPAVNSNSVSRFADAPFPTNTFCFSLKLSLSGVC